MNQNRKFLRKSAVYNHENQAETIHPKQTFEKVSTAQILRERQDYDNRQQDRSYQEPEIIKRLDMSKKNLKVNKVLLVSSPFSGDFRFPNRKRSSPAKREL